MKPLKIVRQTDDKTCSSACLAMLTGLPLEQVIDEFHDSWHGNELTPYDYLKQNQIPVLLNNNPYNSTLFEGWVYLVTVPSLNYEGILHHVVVDYRSGKMDVFDPNEGRTDKRYYVNRRKINENEVIISSWVLDLRVHIPLDGRSPIDKIKRDEELNAYYDDDSGLFLEDTF